MYVVGNKKMEKYFAYIHKTHTHLHTYTVPRLSVIISKGQQAYSSLVPRPCKSIRRLQGNEARSWAPTLPPNWGSLYTSVTAYMMTHRSRANYPWPEQ